MTDVLTLQDEFLFRQIHPSCLQDGEPASDQFAPRVHDAGCLSVDRQTLTTPANAHANYTASGKRLSSAVFGISVGEFAAESISCRSDPLEADGDEPANPAHALADFNANIEKKWKTIGKRLKRIAVARGKLFP